MMSFLKVAVLLFFTTFAFAQSVFINSPQNGTSVPAGENLTVQVVKPDSLTGSQDVAVVIGLASCTSGVCSPPVGTILYDGPYNPQFIQPNLPPRQPYQNFSVAIPASWTKGAAQLNVVHFALVGVSQGPLVDSHSASITVV